MTEVTLTVPEYISAVQVAIARFMVSELSNMNHASTYQRTWFERLQEEIVGACGERAWGKYRNQHWDASVNTFHNVPDARGNVEIRATTRDDGRLIVRANDSQNRYYVLVTGEPPVLVIRGWMQGKDARRDQWVSNPHGHRQAWFVPQSALKQFGESA